MQRHSSDDWYALIIQSTNKKRTDDDIAEYPTPPVAAEYRGIPPQSNMLHYITNELTGYNVEAFKKWHDWWSRLWISLELVSLSGMLTSAIGNSSKRGYQQRNLSRANGENHFSAAAAQKKSNHSAAPCDNYQRILIE